MLPYFIYHASYGNYSIEDWGATHFEELGFLKNNNHSLIRTYFDVSWIPHLVCLIQRRANGCSNQYAKSTDQSQHAHSPDSWSVLADYAAKKNLEQPCSNVGRGNMRTYKFPLKLQQQQQEHKSCEGLLRNFVKLNLTRDESWYSGLQKPLDPSSGGNNITLHFYFFRRVLYYSK